MPYDLSFSDEFFWGEGEPYEKSDKPTSVMQALHSLSDADWNLICDEVFDKNRDISTHEVMAHIREVDTCSNLNTPVKVWIDEQGYHTVAIYDSAADEKEEQEEQGDDTPCDERGYPLPTVDEPDFKDLEHMLLFRGTCDATDGCIVEPDGECEHGHVSWGRYLGFV